MAPLSADNIAKRLENIGGKGNWENVEKLAKAEVPPGSAKKSPKNLTSAGF
jgi:hypothetical protein